MKKSLAIVYFSLTIALLLYSNTFYSQNTDTIKIKITNDVYDTIRIYDTIVKYDTIWVDSKFEEIRIGPSTSMFFCKWRKYNDQAYELISQQNYSIGLESDIVFEKFIFSPGFFLTQFKESRQFDYSISEIDSTFLMQLIPLSYIDYDTTGVSWIVHTFDSTYYDPILLDTVTTVFTDTLMQYHVDSTTINYNDTVFNTMYDTITNDTTIVRDFIYKYLEVPLIVNYRLAKFKHLSLDIGAGLIAGLLIKSESYYFDAESSAVLSYEKSDTYSFLPSLWVSLGVEYSLGDSFLIRLEPYYNPGLRSILKPEAGISGIPDRYGVKFEIKYLF